MTRNEVFQCLQRERLFQQKKWKTPSVFDLGMGPIHATKLIDDDKEVIEWSHDILSWIGMMEVYLNDAKHELTHFGGQIGRIDGLHELRKAVALGVACLEQHGCPERKVELDSSEGQNMVDKLLEATLKAKEAAEKEMEIEGLQDFVSLLDEALKSPPCDDPTCVPCNQKRLQSKDAEIERLKKLVEKSLVTNPKGV